MRLVTLELLAFGPFTDLTLELGDRPGLHLVYGVNEAGKSTALRAISGLLYGIPERTADAHRHDMSKLRVGAVLAAGGETLEVVRRKGRKDTLLDRDGRPLDEARLEALLGGVDATLFATLYGLDHVTLRLGAEALLAGGGGVGESLFDAGRGGAATHTVLRELERRCAELFLPQGRKPRLNAALADYRDAVKRRRDSELSASAWREQREALERFAREREELAAHRRELGAEAARLRRTLTVLPLLGRRQDLLRRRAELGEVAPLGADAAERRARAEQALAVGEAEAARLDAQLAELRRRSEELAPAGPLDELEAEVAEELQDRLGSQRKAAADLPRRQGELATLEDEARAVLRALGDPREPAAAGDLRPPAGAEARRRALADERGERAAALALAERAAADLAARGERAREALAAVPETPVPDPLRRAADAAAKLGEAGERRAALESAAERAAHELARRLEALGRWRGTADEAVALPVPPDATVERFAGRWRELAEAAAERERRRQRWAADGAEVAAERQRLEAAGAVPGSDELTARRQRRDASWRALRRGWEADPPDRAAATAATAAYEAEVAAADEMADRLWRDAARVARAEELAGRAAALAAEAAALETAGEQQGARLAALRAEWAEVWRPSGVEPLPPAEMREWLVRLETLRGAAESHAAAAAERDLWARRVAEHRERLAAELAAVGAAAPADEPLELLVERARGAVAAALERAGEHARRERALADLETQLAAATAEREAARRAWEDWCERWRAAAAALGLGAEATVEEAREHLEQRARLAAKLDEIGRLRQRVAALEGDAERFAGDVAALVERHLPEVSARPPEEAAAALLGAWRQAAEARRERRRLATQGEEVAAQRARVDEAIDRARAELAELVAAAGVGTAGELPAAEQRWRQADDLERAVAEVERELAAHGGGATPEELATVHREADRDRAAARLDEVEEELEELGEQLTALANRSGGAEEGLRHMEEMTGAARAAEEAEEALAAVLTHGREYAVLRLAAVLLAREVERYREENQGPVLARAAELFPRLTRGRYGDLRTGYGPSDEPVLRCVGADGVERGVDELSEGTRDQLYLALRLATLERQAASGETLPLVLDDVLIHFDDERARAALEVLGEVASRGQVLFFTHHQRLVELAEEAVPAAQRTVHRLPAP